MRYLLILVALTMIGCASTPLERRRNDIKNCAKELMEYDATANDAVDGCIKIYRRKENR